MGYRPSRTAATRSAAATFGHRVAADRASLFCALCREFGVPEPTPELPFHPVRKWRFDFAWPDAKLALESEGGTWSGGRHTRGAGYRRDLQKYNAATLLGWRMLRVPSDELCRLETVELVRDVLAATP